MIKIKVMEAGQGAHLAKLQSLAFSQAYSDVHSSVNIKTYCEGHYRADVAEIALSSQTTVCSMGILDSQPSGYSILKHQACPIELGATSSELVQIYVLKSAYGTGLAQALYEHALSVIRTKGNKWVWLCVSDANHRARAFYRKLEFATVGSGPVLEVGSENLASSILAREL